MNVDNDDKLWTLFGQTKLFKMEALSNYGCDMAGYLDRLLILSNYIYHICQPYAMLLNLNLSSIMLAFWFLAEPKVI